MNDRELIELAAKAAGIEPLGKAFELNGDFAFAGFSMPAGKVWNPLTDDGDALRLAVKLHLNIFIGRQGTGVNDGEIPLRNFPIAVEHHGDDPYAATRRAIVRAAAEIGREMK